MTLSRRVALSDAATLLATPHAQTRTFRISTPLPSTGSLQIS